MQHANCLNCGKSLDTEDRYCSLCSQRADTHRITFHHIFHEGFHALTHADKGILHLIKGLATQPGVVVREYIEGKRKKYYNPFTFLLISLGLVVFVNSIFHPFFQKNMVDPNILAHIPTEAGKERYIALMTRLSKFTHFTETNSNLIFLVASPIISLVYLLSFYKQKYNYAEYVVANIFFGGFFSVLSAILISPLLGASKGTQAYPYVLIGSFIIHGLYYGWGYYQMFGYKNKIHLLRTFLVTMLSILVWTILSGVGTYFYLKYG